MTARTNVWTLGPYTSSSKNIVVFSLVSLGSGIQPTKNVQSSRANNRKEGSNFLNVSLSRDKVLVNTGKPKTKPAKPASAVVKAKQPKKPAKPAVKANKPPAKKKHYLPPSYAKLLTKSQRDALLVRIHGLPPNQQKAYIAKVAGNSVPFEKAMEFNLGWGEDEYSYFNQS